MKNKKRNSLRRTYIVDRGFQYNLILRAAGYVVFTMLVMCAGLFLPLMESFEGANPHTLSSYDSATALLYMHDHFWPVALLCLLVAVIGVMRVSNRIAGPLLRVKRDMRELSNGTFPAPLQSRGDDYLKDEIAVFNGMVSSLAGRVDELRQASVEMQSALEACREQASDPLVLDEVTEKADAISDLLTQFRIPVDEPRRVEPVEEPEPALSQTS